MRFRVAIARWTCRRRGHIWVGTTVSWWQSTPSNGPEYHVEPGPKICSRCKETDGPVHIPGADRVEQVALTENNPLAYRRL